MRLSWLLLATCQIPLEVGDGKILNGAPRQMPPPRDGGSTQESPQGTGIYSTRHLLRLVGGFGGLAKER